MIWKMKKGDLIRFTSGRYKGMYATTTSGKYVHRFMDNQDWEMVSHGMGEYAGSYGSAFNVVFSDGGTRSKIDAAKNSFVIVSNEDMRSSAEEA